MILVYIIDILFSVFGTWDASRAFFLGGSVMVVIFQSLHGVIDGDTLHSTLDGGMRKIIVLTMSACVCEAIVR